MATLLDNLTEFLEDKLKEFNPDLAVGEGTAIRDLFIKPFSTVLQPIADEILSIRSNLSLADAEDLPETDLDRLAANYFVTRKTGSKATGTVRLYFSQPVDEFVPQGTVFIAANGVRFLSRADTTITSSGLRLNTFGDLFFQDIAVEAELAGVSGNIAANLITDLLSGSDKVVDVANPAEFSGGTDVETNAELMTRLAIAITFRNLINKPGAKLILLENFERLLDVFVVGFGDRHQVTGEDVGTGTGAQTVYQLDETEDVIASLAKIYLEVQDELVATGPLTNGFQAVDFFPFTRETLALRYGASFVAGTALRGTRQSVLDELVGTGDNVQTAYQLDHAPVTPGTLELRKGFSFTSGTPLVLTTDYTVDLDTGAITLTGAGVTALGTDQLRARYTAEPHFVASPSVVSDEFVGLGDGVETAYQLNFFPVTAGSLELHVGTITGTLLVDPTDYTVNLATGEITLTAAGVTALGTSALRAKYTTSPTAQQFGLTKEGATFLGANPLRAQYTTDALDSSLVSSDFDGVVTFTAAPSAGALITADYSYHLMRRDRLSGDNLVLGDDSFGTQSNVHIGGKVDFYLRFQGLEEQEVRLNGVKAENFLFAQGIGDPAPTATQQYLSTVPLPIIFIKNIEMVDPGTNLPSGIFLGAPTDYTLDILSGKVNVNMSMRQKVKLAIPNPAFQGTDILLRYFTHADFDAVQDFVDDDVNRIVTADLLARAPMPVFVDVAINYARLEGGPDAATVQQVVEDFINGRKLGQCVSIYDLTKTLSDAGVRFVQLPITLSATKVNLDFTETAVTSTDRLEFAPNFQFVARTVTVTEVALPACDAI